MTPANDGTLAKVQLVRHWLTVVLIPTLVLVSACTRTDLVSEEPTDTFVLSEEPDPESIVVTIEGGEVSGWSYSEDLNAVVFDAGSWPAGGTDIGVSYWPAGACE